MLNDAHSGWFDNFMKIKEYIFLRWTAIFVLFGFPITDSAHSQGLIDFKNSTSTLVQCSLPDGTISPFSTEAFGATIHLFYQYGYDEKPTPIWRSGSLGAWTPLGNPIDVAFDGSFDSGNLVAGRAGEKVWLQAILWDSSYQDFETAQTSSIIFEGSLEFPIIAGSLASGAASTENLFPGFYVFPVPEPSPFTIVPIAFLVFQGGYFRRRLAKSF